MVVLVTGANGFIGARLCQRLRQEGEEVVALVRSPQKTIPGMRTAVADICDRDALARTLDGMEFSCVFHLAAKISSKKEDEEEMRRTNIEGTRNLLDALVQLADPPTKFIYSSTQQVYGAPENLPVAETATPHPLDAYGRSKWEGEEIAQTYADRMGTIILRYSGVYGKEKKGGLIANAVRAAQSNEPIAIPGDGKQSRDFVWVEDVVGANVLAMRYAGCDRRKSMVYNIGGGEEFRLAETAERIAKLFKKTIRITYTPENDGEKKRFWLDIRKAKKELEYRPTPLEEAVHREWG